MEPDRAITVLAEFMAGGRVKEKEVMLAYRVLKTRNPSALRRLKTELLLQEPAPANCSNVQAELDRYLGLSESRLKQEFPEVAHHLSDCTECGKLWWMLKPAWNPSGNTGKPDEIEKILADVIEIDFGARGKIKRVSGRPCEQKSTQAVAMGLGEDDNRYREWILDDAESSTSIRLLIIGSTSKQARLNLEITDLDGNPRPVEQFRIQLFEQDHPLPLIDAPLALSQIGETKLKPGDWRLIVIWKAPDQTRRFEIPISLESSKK